MRAILVLAVLILLFLLVRNSTTLDAGLARVNPVLAGYGALFVAGIVAAELLRPLLSLLAPAARFVVVALLAGLIWLGFDLARQSGRLSDLLAGPEIAVSRTRPDAAETTLAPAWDGLFRTVAVINLRSVGVVVDAATPVVLLTYDEARRMGLAPERLEFDQRIAVSDRKVAAAALPDLPVSIGEVEVLNVETAVAAQGELETSLVGLSFLSRLNAVEIRGGEMILRH